MTRRASLLVVITYDGSVVLQHRDSGAPRWPDAWCHFGGTANDGESFDDCLRREIREEVGIVPPGVERVGTVHDEQDGAESAVYCCRVSADTVLFMRAHQTEGDGIGLFAPVALAGLRMPEHCREAVRVAMAKQVKGNR